LEKYSLNIIRIVSGIESSNLFFRFCSSFLSISSIIETRELKELEILSKGDQIKRISSSEYRINSQNGNGSYLPQFNLGGTSSRGSAQVTNIEGQGSGFN